MQRAALRLAAPTGSAQRSRGKIPRGRLWETDLRYERKEQVSRASQDIFGPSDNMSGDRQFRKKLEGRDMRRWYFPSKYSLQDFNLGDYFEMQNERFEPREEHQCLELMNKKLKQVYDNREKIRLFLLDLDEQTFLANPSFQDLYGIYRLVFDDHALSFDIDNTVWAPHSPFQMSPFEAQDLLDDGDQKRKERIACITQILQEYEARKNEGAANSFKKKLELSETDKDVDGHIVKEMKAMRLHLNSRPKFVTYSSSLDAGNQNQPHSDKASDATGKDAAANPESEDAKLHSSASGSMPETDALSSKTDVSRDAEANPLKSGLSAPIPPLSALGEWKFKEKKMTVSLHSSMRSFEVTYGSAESRKDTGILVPKDGWWEGMLRKNDGVSSHTMRLRKSDTESDEIQFEYFVHEWKRADVVKVNDLSFEELTKIEVDLDLSQRREQQSIDEEKEVDEQSDPRKDAKQEADEQSDSRKDAEHKSAHKRPEVAIIGLHRKELTPYGGSEIQTPKYKKLTKALEPNATFIKRRHRFIDPMFRRRRLKWLERQMIKKNKAKEVAFNKYYAEHPDNTKDWPTNKGSVTIPWPSPFH